MDFFKDLADIRHSFQILPKLIPAHGTLIINRDIDDYQEITEGLSCKVITYSVDKEDADFYRQKILLFDNECHGSFDLYVNGEEKRTLSH